MPSAAQKINAEMALLNSMNAQERARTGRPLGLSIVAVLTLLSSFALFMLFVTGNLLAVVGGEFQRVDWFYWWTANPSIPISLFLAVYAFSVSICLFMLRTRTVWYASVIFWAITLLFFLWWGYMISWRHIGEWLTFPMSLYTFYLFGEVIITLAPLLYSIACLTYFQTRRIRNYFHLAQ